MGPGEAGIRRHFNYSNVMSTLAVFLVVTGGTAMAAAVSSSKDIAKQAVKNSDVKKNTLKSNRLKNGKAVTGADVVDDSLEGIDINESTLDISQPSSLPPSGPAGGDLAGTYPNPNIGNSKVTSAKIANGAVTESKISDAIATKAGNEAVREVGTAGNPPFGAGWANLGGGFELIGFFKDQFGIVHLRGLANCNDGTTMFNLPSGYRPARIHYQNVGTGALSGSGVDFLGRVSITADGNVVVLDCGGGFTALSNIQFLAAG